ncbi:MAG: hypothetical protein KBF76_10505 [Verrucomicrobiales bacterium]|jgi:hypothetical protein|nr:hypothetical protein [Verrucomicrobiales bacterium]
MKYSAFRLILPILLFGSVLLSSSFAQNRDKRGISISPHSDPVKARIDARKISKEFIAQGYEISPVGKGDNFEGTNLIFQVELIKGMDYVIMVGIDDAMPNVDLYVKSESGNMIQQDTRDITRALVTFSSDYNGVCYVTVKPSPSEVIGNFAVLVGYQPGF